MELNEAQTRAALINPQLETASWNLSDRTQVQLEVPVPPNTLQQKFASLVERHERLQAGQLETLRQAEHLFQSLLHRAFTTGL